MKYAALLFLILANGAAAWAQKPSAAPVAKGQVQKVPVASFPPMPKLNPGQFAVFYDDKYQIFTTQKFDSVEMDLSCFKKGKAPQCQAYAATKTALPHVEPKDPHMNHPAALNCEGKGGQNLIALDPERHEYDFCRFADGSMINSWNLYRKQVPQNVIK